MEYDLSHDAEYLLCVLYKNYIDRRKNGEDKSKAKMMNSSEHIFNTLLSEWKFEDVDETCRELDRAGLLNCQYGDNIVYFSVLNDNAIIYMENRYKRGISEVIDTISKLKSLIF